MSFAAQDGAGVPLAVADGDTAGEADVPGLPEAPGEGDGT
jgi:hypothetical protein